MAGTAKVTLDELIAHPERADHIGDDQVRDVLKEIAERTAALEALHSQIIWRLVSFRNAPVEGFPPLLNAKQMAEHLAVPETWVREQARLGELPAVKLGHYVRFRIDDVQRRIAQMSGSPLNDNRGAGVSSAPSAKTERQRPSRGPQHG